MVLPRREIGCVTVVPGKDIDQLFLGREVRENLCEELRWAIRNRVRTRVGQMRCLDSQV